MKRNFLTIGLLIAAGCFLFSCSGTANTNNSNAYKNTNNANANKTPVAAATPASSDNDFLTKAAQGGMAEVELGKIAVQKATNPEVKKFAQKMVDDHTKANNELKELAAKKGVTLPTEIDSSHRSAIDKMKGLSGADFDKAYVDAMVDDHETDVDEFEEQSKDAKDADIKAFAAKTLPTLKSHLELINGIQAKMK
jgi:putative membrane protein